MIYCYEEAGEHYAMGWGFAEEIILFCLKKMWRLLLNINVWFPLECWQSLEYKQYLKALDFGHHLGIGYR